MDDNGLGIWFADDIENVLLAIDEANLDMAARFDAPEVRIYRAGFAAALSAVATAFGLPLGFGAFGGRGVLEAEVREGVSQLRIPARTRGD